MLSPRKNMNNGKLNVKKGNNLQKSSNYSQNRSPTKQNGPGMLSTNYKNLSKQALCDLIDQKSAIIAILQKNNNDGFKSARLIRLENCEQTTKYSSQQSLKSQITTHNQQLRCLKVKLSNSEFELKKTSQDAAEQMMKVKMYRDRDIKKFKQDILNLQIKIKQDNNKWSQKCLQLRLIYQNLLASQKDQLDKFMSEQNKKIELLCEQRIAKIEVNHVNQIKILKETHIKQIKQVNQILSLKFDQAQIQYQQKISLFTQNQIKQVKKLQKVQEEMRIAFDGQKLVEKKKKDDEQINNAKVKEKLYNDLYLVRKQKDELNKQILELKGGINCFEKKLKQKDYEKHCQQHQFKEESDKIRCQHINQLQKQVCLNVLRVQDLKNQQNLQIKSLQKSLADVKQLKNNIQIQYQKKLKDLSQLYQGRHSRIEDLNKIDQLIIQINENSNLINEIKGQLKKQKLQRQNNERNYKRIFSACGPRQKTQRTQRTQRAYVTVNREKQIIPKQKIYRMANTVDVNFILKVCNKNF